MFFEIDPKFQTKGLFVFLFHFFPSLTIPFGRTVLDAHKFTKFSVAHCYAAIVESASAALSSTGNWIV